MSSIRRVKERGGAGGKVTAAAPPSFPPFCQSKPLKALPEYTLKENNYCEKVAGKEVSARAVPGRTPVVGQQVATRHPLRRIEKVDSGGELETRVRRSISSLPRGKNPNHSDFACFHSDLRKDRLSRVSKNYGQAVKAPFSGSNRSMKTRVKPMIDEIGINDLPAKGGKVGDFVRVSENCTVESCSDSVLGNHKNEACLDSKEAGENDVNSIGILEDIKNVGYFDSKETGDKIVNGVRDLEICKDETSLDPKETSKKNANDVRVLQNLRNKSYFDVNETGEKDLTAVRVLENCKNESHFDSKETGEKVVNGVSLLENLRNEPLYNLNETSENVVNGARVLEDRKNGAHFDSEETLEKELNTVSISENCEDEAYFDLKGTGKKVNTGKVLENLKADCLDLKNTGFGVEEKGTRVVSRYPSRLHEKLAFLEGRVKRIASDIKKTKEMLDKNNPEVSKSILLDIQDKVSGIEKSMGHLIKEKSKLGLFEREIGAKGNCSKSQGVAEIQHSWSVNSANKNKNELVMEKAAAKTQKGFVSSLKNSVKGLNQEELEARLFPHHKLLRNRPSLSNFTVKDGSGDRNRITGISVSHDNLTKENGSPSPSDENLIALEFLASLKQKNPSLISTDNRTVQQECSVIREIVSNVSLQAENAAPSAGLEVSGNEVDGIDDLRLHSDETLEFNDQENKPDLLFCEETVDSCTKQLREIGQKSSTGGWFVSEGESVLLAHADSSCSFFDITHSDGKAEYTPPPGVSNNLWGDCWLIRTAGSDGCSGRYVVAASAGNTLDSGFCSWDFYSKEIRAFRFGDETVSSSSTTVLAPRPNSGVSRRKTLSTILPPANQQWWYKPCGPLLVSVATGQRAVRVYDIRDGDLVMNWEVQKSVSTMEYTSPLQWRNKGKVVIAETEAISLWDINSLSPHPLLSISSSSKKASALHVNNTDAELGGGVRQRVSSSEAEGNDGVFCTLETVNILDFRLPSGVGLKIPKLGSNGQSIFTRGDSIFLGCIETRLAAKGSPQSRVQQFSARKGKLVSSYTLPDSSTHFQQSTITQVWGSSQLVMGICGRGLFVFDTLKDERMQSVYIDQANTREVRETIGPDDLYAPSFDYLASRVLLISRDRPALWRYLS